MNGTDSFSARDTLTVDDTSYEIWRLSALERAGFDVASLPYSLKVLLENLLRNENGADVAPDDIRARAGVKRISVSGSAAAFHPASARRSSGATSAPFSLRSRFSRRTFSE